MRLRTKVTISVGIPVIIIALAIGSIEYTSRPKFCRTCHYMEPFYDSWKTSGHSDVTCIKCHYPPGVKSKIEGKVAGLAQLVSYVTQVYRKSKPWAEIPDESCLREGCHETRLLEGEVTFKGVDFSHTTHLSTLRRSKKLRCTSCHSQIVQGEHMVVTESTCFICHFKKSEKTHEVADCRKCHSSVEKISRYDHSEMAKKDIDCRRCHRHVVLGEGTVVKEHCYDCHWERERLDRIEETEFLHRTHTTDHKIECLGCHMPIEHRIISMAEEAELNCASCHSGFHQPQMDLYMGIGGRGVSSVPDPMEKVGVSCEGCHISMSHRGMTGTAYAGKKSCSPCHADGYSKLLKSWKKGIDVRVGELTGAYERVYSLTRSKSRKERVGSFLSDAKFNLDLVRYGKGIHNIEYSDTLLSSVSRNLGKAKKTLSLNVSIPDIERYSRAVPDGCSKCHYGVEMVTVDAFGEKFSHKRHLISAELKCEKCHSNAKKHGELIISSKDECLECHHSEQRDCEDCHDDL